MKRLEQLICAIALTILLVYPRGTPHKNPEIAKNNPRTVQQEQQCIAEALWHEARGEPKDGIIAVLEVIQNRTHAKGYASTFCGVVQQPKQFSYRNHLKQGQIVKTDLNKLQQAEREIHTYIQELAFRAAVGSFKGILGDSTVLYYHTVQLKKIPKWSKQNKKYAIIGSHIFISRV